MKVRVKYWSIKDLPEERLQRLENLDRLKSIGYNAGGVPLGTEFTVYGIMFREGNVVYNLADTPEGEILVMCLAELFDIVDPRTSKYWECRIPNEGGLCLWPRSWFELEYYHDRLSDGDPEIEEDFRRIKSLLEAEANEPLPPADE